MTVTAEAPHTGFVQLGAKRMKGRYRSKTKPEPQIPARPFMGISQANRTRISKMVWAHIRTSMRDEGLEDWFGN